MTKISFNAQALGIANYDHRGDVGHACNFRSPVPVMVRDTSVEAIFEALGFSHVESFTTDERDSPAEDVDP